MHNLLVLHSLAIERNTLKSFFLEPEFKVHLAKSVEEVEKIISEVDLDIVIVDETSWHLASKPLILESKRIPVLLLTSESKDLSTSLSSSGFIDFFFLESGKTIDLMSHKQELIDFVRFSLRKKSQPVNKVVSDFASFSRKKIVVIASSTGGPQTVEHILSSLPGSFPVPILLVQHMPIGFTESFAKRLDSLCELNVKEALDGDELRSGTVFIAPAGFHMELIADVEGAEGTIHLNKDPSELGVRPCANKLFLSVSKIFQENTIGVVLTGMGNDGTRGAKEIKDRGGAIIAQGEKSSIIYGMPKSIVQNNLADEVVELEDMAVAIIQLVDL